MKGTVRVSTLNGHTMAKFGFDVDGTQIPPTVEGEAVHFTIEAEGEFREVYAVLRERARDNVVRLKLAEVHGL